jgi:hypothetical protein
VLLPESTRTRGGSSVARLNKRAYPDGYRIELIDRSGK